MASLRLHVIIWQKDCKLHHALVCFRPMLHDFVDTTMHFRAFKNLDFGRGSSVKVRNLNDTSKATSVVEGVNKILNFLKTIVLVGNILCDWKLTEEHLIDEFGHVHPGFPASKSGAFPNSSCNQLEWPCCQFLSSSCNPNDN